MTDSAGLNHGIVLPNWVVGGDPGLLVEYGELAEEAGWDGVFRADHSIPPTEKETESFPRSMAYAYRSRCPDGLDQTGLVDYADSTSPTVASGPKPRNTRSPL